MVVVTVSNVAGDDQSQLVIMLMKQLALTHEELSAAKAEIATLKETRPPKDKAETKLSVVKLPPLRSIKHKPGDRVICECGTGLRYDSLKRHQLSAYHQGYIRGLAADKAKCASEVVELAA